MFPSCRTAGVLLAALTTTLLMAGTPASGGPAAEGGGGGDCPQGSGVVQGAEADPDFQKPIGVDVDDNGDVYVADSGSNAVYRFERDGTQTLTIPASAGDPDLVDPIDVAVEDDGTIWVADDGTNRIHRFNAAGSQTSTIGAAQATPDFQKPEGIAVNGGGTRLWVTDPDSGMIYRFDEAGNQTLAFPETNSTPDPSVASGFNAIALDPTGDVVVVDQGIDHAIRFNADGTQDLAIGPTAGQPDLAATVGVAVDANRNIWVIDQNVDAVYRFGPTGTQTFFIDGVANGGLSFGRRVTIGRQGDVWATDEVNDTLFRWCFRPDAAIRRGSGPFAGDEIVNGSGAGQTRSADLPPGGTINFTVRVDSDGNAQDRFRVQGTAGNSRFRVRYFDGTRDVTAGVTNGTFRTPFVVPGNSRSLRVEVRAEPTAPSGATRTLVVRLTSDAAPARTDTVRAVVTRS